jgi:hypothetical protein
MKRLLLSCLPFGFVFAYAKPEPVDLGRLVDAIAMVENAKTTHIGKAGERSRYQITYAIWKMYSDWDFHLASSMDPLALYEARQVAYQHVRWLSLTLDKPTPYRIAAAWNGGFHAVQSGNITDATADYAKRVRNLYDERHEY